MFKYLILTVSAALFPLLAAAQPSPLPSDYPNKPITLIVAWGLNGPTDIGVRAFMPYLEKQLPGYKFNIVNRTGRRGNIGWTEIARAAPDGYTIGVINAPAVNAMEIEGGAMYAMKDFQPLGSTVFDPGVLGVPEESPYKTLGDLLAAAKKDPGLLVVGTGGIYNGAEQLMLLQMQQKTDSTFAFAPFGETGIAEKALAQNGVQAGIFNVSEAMPMVVHKHLRILAVAHPTRLQFLPDVPTFKELGFDCITGSARGFVVPKGTNPAIVAKLSAAIAAVAKDPAYVAASDKVNIPVLPMSAVEFQQHLQDITATLNAMWKKQPWKPQD